MISAIAACLPPLEPSRPKVPPPPGACDTHAHVFGPSDRFPYAQDRSYTPPDAPCEKYLNMLDMLGFARGALVQGSAHGCDNSAMLDALERHSQRLRGVAVADAGAAPSELRRWADIGVRGLRFNHFFRDGRLHYRGGVPLGAAQTLAPTMAELGWHLQLWIDVRDLPETIPTLKAIGLPVVIDHMDAPMRGPARQRPVSRACCAPSARAGAGQSCRARTGSAGTRRIIRMHARCTRRWWLPIRNGWSGSDWPHPRVEGDMPDAGHLFELFQQWTPDQVVQQRILVANPAKLYGFPN
jgi:2-pyrone-4,6-dicarboxylate lactonase